MSLTEYLKKYEGTLAQGKPLNRRQETIQKFLEIINQERAENPRYKKGDKWVEVKPTSASMIAYQLSHLKQDDLDYLFSICTAYKKEGKGAFSKCFYGSIKPLK